MGTNFYWINSTCKSCGRTSEKHHIGKSSGGWCFSLHVMTEHEENSEGVVYRNLTDWKKLWALPGSTILDEYDTEITYQCMLEIVMERSWPEKEEPGIPYTSWDDFHYKNHSEPGPCGLARHKIDGSRCIEHGEGTYDLIVGEFW